MGPQCWKRFNQSKERVKDRSLQKKICSIFYLQANQVLFQEPISWRNFRILEIEITADAEIHVIKFSQSECTVKFLYEIGSWRTRKKSRLKRKVYLYFQVSFKDGWHLPKLVLVQITVLEESVFSLIFLAWLTGFSKKQLNIGGIKRRVLPIEIVLT